MSTKKWLQKYIFIDQHEIFFSAFANKSHEWLSRLAENQTDFKHEERTTWNPEFIKQLQVTNYKISRVVDYWIDIILGDIINQFTIDTYMFYNEAEHKFFKGLRGKYLNSLKLWIKMLLCEKVVLCIQSY